VGFLGRGVRIGGWDGDLERAMVADWFFGAAEGFGVWGLGSGRDLMIGSARCRISRSIRFEGNASRTPMSE
jgi:hypothetical protein